MHQGFSLSNLGLPLSLGSLSHTIYHNTFPSLFLYICILAVLSALYQVFSIASFEEKLKRLMMVKRIVDMFISVQVKSKCRSCKRLSRLLKFQFVIPLHLALQIILYEKNIFSLPLPFLSQHIHAAFRSLIPTTSETGGKYVTVNGAKLWVVML